GISLVPTMDSDVFSQERKKIKVFRPLYVCRNVSIVSNGLYIQIFETKDNTTTTRLFSPSLISATSYGLKLNRCAASRVIPAIDNHSSRLSKGIREREIKCPTSML